MEFVNLNQNYLEKEGTNLAMKFKHFSIICEVSVPKMYSISSLCGEGASLL